MKKIVTLFTAIVISFTLHAQIPNPGFESWTTVGSYETPDGWDNLDSLTNALSVYTCEKDTPGYPGASYLKLTSKTAGIYVAPGIAVSGKIDIASMAPRSGFAFTSRPANLVGNWQYMAYGADQGHIAVMLSKWNTSTSTRDTVSFTDYALPGMVMSWATFSIPLTYLSGSVPDTALIVLSASGTTPVNMSYLYVDSLAFSGSVPTTGFAAVTPNTAGLSLFPNPSKGTTGILFNSTDVSNARILITDLAGACIFSQSEKCIVGNNRFAINTTHFAPGVYAVRVTNNTGSYTGRLVVE